MITLPASITTTDLEVIVFDFEDDSPELVCFTTDTELWHCYEPGRISPELSDPIWSGTRADLHAYHSERIPRFS